MQGVHQNHDQLCMGGRSSAGYVDHLVLSCNFFWFFWSMISHCIGFDTVHPTHIRDHLRQFCHLGGSSKNLLLTMHLSWLSCVWAIWNERNRRIFKHEELCSNHLLEKIKLLTFEWLKEKYTTFAFNNHFWWQTPLKCLRAILSLCFFFFSFLLSFFLNKK